MIIATSITESYFKNSKPFFESVNKNFSGKKICFCIGFYIEIEGWITVEVKKEDIECKWQPKNREECYSLQHGEFTRFFNFDDEDVVMFVDSDMILQRPVEIQFLPKQNTFIVTDSSFPPTKFKEVIKNLKCETYGEVFCNIFNLSGNEEEFCAGLMISKIRTWKFMYCFIKAQYKKFLENFTHHAAWQLFINKVLIQYFRVEKTPPHFCNADCSK